MIYGLHADHLGSTSVLSDGSGQPAGDRVAYLPYGGLRLGDASTLPTDYTFTGQRNEAGLGLMHYGARFYSPRLGRFVSADTIVPQPGNPQALNRYAYVTNNPLRYTDPSGHDPWWRGCPPLPPQPPDTTWDTGLRYRIEPGGLYGEGNVYWNVGRDEVGPISVFVPPANSQGFNWPAYEEGWKQIGGDYIGLSDTTKRGLWNQAGNAAASYAAAHQQDIPSTMAMVPQRFNVDSKYVGQDQDIKGPDPYGMGGMGSGFPIEAAMSLPAAIMPGENISLRYVSITIEQKLAIE